MLKTNIAHGSNTKRNVSTFQFSCRVCPDIFSPSSSDNDLLPSCQSKCICWVSKKLNERLLDHFLHDVLMLVISHVTFFERTNIINIYDESLLFLYKVV
jgi:hypothetical protein